MPRHRKERVPRHRADRRLDRSPRPVEFGAAITQVGAALDELTLRVGPSSGDAYVVLGAPLADDAAEAQTAPLARTAAEAEAAPVASSAGGSSGKGAAAGGRDRPQPAQPGQHARARAPRSADDSKEQQRWVIRGAARGVLVTPWFAAGSAGVIAAGLWLTMPHASLQLSDPPITQPCTGAACVEPGGAANPSATARGTLGHGHHVSTPAAGASSRKVSGVTAKYTVLWQKHGLFVVLVTVTSKHALGRWEMSFSMPGTHIKDVYGALWKPSASGDGGTVSAFGDGHFPGHPDWPGLSGSLGGAEAGGLPGASSQDGNGSSGPHSNNSPGPDGVEPHVGARSASSARFMIYGAGSPSKPVGCLFNGASCTFS